MSDVSFQRFDSIDLFDIALQLTDSVFYEIDHRDEKMGYFRMYNNIFDIPDGMTVDYTNFFSFIHPDDFVMMKQFFREKVSEKAINYKLEYRIVRYGDKKILTVKDTGVIVYDEAGEAQRRVGCFIDITDMKKLEKKILNRNHLFKEFFKIVSEFVFIKSYKGSNDGIYIDGNQAFEEFIGKGRSEYLGKNDYEVFEQKDAEQYRTEDYQVLQTRENTRSITSRIINGEKHEFETIKGPFYNEKNEIVGVIGVGKDITEYRVIEREKELIRKKAEFYAYVDLLTQVNNRNFFNHKIDMIQRKLENENSYLGMIDINGFKQINDTKGHRIGDIILQEVGCSLKEVTKNEDIVIRYGGDEFLVILTGYTQKDLVQWESKLVGAINDYCKNNYFLQEVKVPRVELAIGYVQPRKGQSIDDMIKIADQEMYADKAAMRKK